MRSPLVSVVISNFNYGRYLQGCIESVLKQTYSPIQLIVVDDGSDDESAEILDRYKDSVEILHSDRQGETATRNLGFSKVRGEIVAFLDADDLWKPTAVRSVVEAWKPDLAKLQFRLNVVDQDGNATGGMMPNCRLDQGDVLPLLLRSGRYITSPTSGNFYARTFLDQICPVPTGTWPQSMDSYAATYAGFSASIGAIQKGLGSYRVHASNMTRISGSSEKDLLQIDRLIERAERLKRLIQTLADSRGLTCSPDIVTSHWLYLKLLIARHLLLPAGSRESLLPLCVKMIQSIIRAPELSFRQRMQWVAWTAAIVTLPRTRSKQLVGMSFDLVSAKSFVRLVRRSWG